MRWQRRSPWSQSPAWISPPPRRAPSAWQCEALLDLGEGARHPLGVLGDAVLVEQELGGPHVVDVQLGALEAGLVEVEAEVQFTLQLLSLQKDFFF